MTDDVVATYEANAGTLRERFDGMATEQVLGPVLDHVLPPPAAILDIGAGSGRDAAWFAGRGHAVTAAEPVAAFRAAIAARLPGARVLDARLPDLAGITGPFAMILASAVWHHLAPAERDRALARLRGLLPPGGRLLLSLRHGAAGQGGMVHALDAAEEAARAAARGLCPVLRRTTASQQPANIADGITWTWLVLEREDAT